jgi:hypothetical protein
MRGLTRSLALDRDGDHLVSRSAMICGFVRMQGAGARLAADPEQDPVLVAAGNRWFTLAVVDGDSFAYLTTRPAAQAMVEQVRVWDRDHRREWPGRPRMTHQTGALPDRMIDPSQRPSSQVRRAPFLISVRVSHHYSRFRVSG